VLKDCNCGVPTLALEGAGRRRDVQLAKTANWKQRTLRLLHFVLAMENGRFSRSAQFDLLTEHEWSTDEVGFSDRSQIQRPEMLSRLQVP
jgi:hypothetical protein